MIPAEPSGISIVPFLFSIKQDMEDKNRIKTAREVPKNDVIKVSLFIIVLSMGNFFRAAWTRALRFETDISHPEFMIFAAAGRVNDQNAAGPEPSPEDHQPERPITRPNEAHGLINSRPG